MGDFYQRFFAQLQQCDEGDDQHRHAFGRVKQLFKLDKLVRRIQV